MRFLQVLIYRQCIQSKPIRLNSWFMNKYVSFVTYSGIFFNKYSLNISNEIYIKQNQSWAEYRGFCEHNVDYIFESKFSEKKFIIIPEQFCDT